MNIKDGFWTSEHRYPNDTETYLFLRRALDVVAKAMFGDRWTGDEPLTEFLPPLPVFPVSSGGHALRAHQLLLRHHPEFNRQLPEKPSSDHPFSRALPAIQFTRQEWDAARAQVDQNNEQAMPGLLRLDQVKQKIIQLAEAGALVTAVREKAGGAMTILNRDFWNSEHILNRFDCYQMTMRAPFGLGSTGDDYQWIFVGRESLANCCEKIAKERKAEQPTGTSGQSRPPRRIAKSQIEREFQAWRSNQQKGYVPTEAEDTAFMKSLGVGRDTVRELRKRFPRRQRGEKKEPVSD